MVLVLELLPLAVVDAAAAATTFAAPAPILTRWATIRLSRPTTLPALEADAAGGDCLTVWPPVTGLDGGAEDAPGPALMVDRGARMLPPAAMELVN